MDDTTTQPKAAKEHHPGRIESLLLGIKPKHLRVLLLGVVVAILVVIVLYRHEITNVQDLVRRVGYPIVFVVPLMGAASFVIPIPGDAAIFFGGAFLNPLLVGPLAGLAEGIGETTGYLVGYSGTGMLENSRLYHRLHGWVERRGWLVVFVFSCIPNPIYDIVGISAGALRLPLPKFILAAIVGKTIKNTAIAFAGAEGAHWLLRLLGGN